MQPTDPKPTAETRPRLDADTLRQVRVRSPEALNTFFTHFFDRAYAYACRLLGHRELAQDVVQDAFMRMHAAIDRLDPMRDPAPWVFTVLTNVARDHWRSRAARAARNRVDLDSVWERVADDVDADPALRYEADERAAAVRRALGRLAPADREILLLREFEQLSTAEIAAILKLSPDAVRQRVSRAVRRLGVAYKEPTDAERGSHEAR